MKVQRSGRRKDVTAFLLFQKGEEILSTEQFDALKVESRRLGITAENFEQCTLAQLEEMYIDALWAYYNDGVQLLSDEQYNQLRRELQFQASGFPSLRREEVNFVKASIAYWRGDPIMPDEEWQALKTKVVKDGKRKDVTAFLLYSKGQEVLDAETFEQMKTNMEKMGVYVKKADTMPQTLSDISDRLENDSGSAIYMVASLSIVPVLLSVASVLGLGSIVEEGFLSELGWGAAFPKEILPRGGVGVVLGLALTYRLLVFLDLQGPRVYCGNCPSCGYAVRLCSSGANPPLMVEHRCKSCGGNMLLDIKERRIQSAGSRSKTDQQGSDFQRLRNDVKGSAKITAIA